MQYKVAHHEHLTKPGHRRWDVIATDKDGGYMGCIARFNTEQQARDYAKVQEGIEVKFVRYDKPRHANFKVLINGEHRAMFEKRFLRAGYWLKAADGSDITGSYHRGCGDFITQADFELVVRSAIAEGAVPTLAQIEISRLHAEAWVENRMWDKARDEHRARVRTEVLTVALENYLGQPFGSDEHKAMAERMLAGLKNGSGWL